MQMGRVMLLKPDSLIHTTDIETAMTMEMMTVTTPILLVSFNVDMGTIVITTVTQTNIVTCRTLKIFAVVVMALDIMQQSMVVTRVVMATNAQE